MQNLARNKNRGIESCREVTETCRRELEMARIPVVDVVPEGEVPSSVGGKLGEFEFRRLWYYWAVRGRVPIALARTMYEDPLGKAMVRVAGHCGCPPPDQKAKDGRLCWAEWLKDGKNVLQAKTEAELLKLYKEDEWWRERYLFHDDPASIGAECFVTLYHIDDLAGLRLFADMVRPLALKNAVATATEEADRSVAKLNEAMRVSPEALQQPMTI